MKRFVPFAVAAAALTMAVAVASAGSAPDAGSSAKSKSQHTAKVLTKALKNKAIVSKLEKLNSIAKANDGNRASGTSGYDASADYVARQLKRYGWKVERQPFDFINYTQEAPSTFQRTSPNPTNYTEDTEFSTMEYSGSGDVTAELVAIDLTLPPSPEPGSTSGCEATDFEGVDVTGKVALMQRGSCDFADKVNNAEAAGAVASVIFNEGQEGRTDVVFGTLGSPVGIPAIDTTFAIGAELAGEATNGPTGTTVHIVTETSFEEIATSNVIAETKQGNKDRVVMAGAHLDSVSDGPGINDNGTGSATLMAIAQQISKKKIKPKQKLRFAWWGAEEQGLIGSTEYIADLTNRQGAKIALYLNFDMLGSPNYARLIYDGNASAFEASPPAGSAAIERTFSRYFESQGLATGQTAFDGRSDYGPFIDVGIPAGGLFSGAEEIKTDAEQAAYGGTVGEAFDPCYHQGCDDIDNISKRGLRELSDGVAWAVGSYAMKLAFIPRQPEEMRAARKALRNGKVASEYLGDSLRR